MKKLLISILLILIGFVSFSPVHAATNTEQKNINPYPKLSWYESQTSNFPQASLDTMAEIIKQAYKTLPNATIDQIRYYIWTELNKLNTNSSLGTVQTESYSIYDLTFQEQLLLISEPWNAWPTKVTRDLAVNEANLKWPGSQFQTKADAFRHAYWNVLMAKRINEDWARKYSTAHESVIKVSLTDTQMDMNNNAVGRAIWRSYTNRSEVEYSSIIKSFAYAKIYSCLSSYVPYLVYLVD